ncbi:hypothetical protein FQ185_01745 [Pseudomonas sp. ANT_H12B]|nr:hypothetical protein FQ185_01745 [Pseudomonas sp. ANT_H12B]
MGASLLAKTVDQSTLMSHDTLHSRAGSLPQWDLRLLHWHRPAWAYSAPPSWLPVRACCYCG